MMTDKTTFYVVEQGRDIIIKEKEGVAKNGDPKQMRISKFKEPLHVMNYFREKYGIST